MLNSISVFFGIIWHFLPYNFSWRGPTALKISPAIHTNINILSEIEEYSLISTKVAPLQRAPFSKNIVNLQLKFLFLYEFTIRKEFEKKKVKRKTIQNFLKSNQVIIAFQYMLKRFPPPLSYILNVHSLKKSFVKHLLVWLHVHLLFFFH